MADRRHKVAAACLAGIYLAACAWALWSKLDAVLLLAVVSPVAAAFTLPKGTRVVSRVLLGAAIDGSLAALAFVPVVGDLIDLGASAVAIVLLVIRFGRLAGRLPGGLACVALYAFLFLEAGFLPRHLSVSGAHHPSWYYPVAVALAVLAGGVLLGVLAWLLSLMYERDRAKAVFFIIGFPWYLATFLLAIFIPDHNVKHAHHVAAGARRPA